MSLLFIFQNEESRVKQKKGKQNEELTREEMKEDEVKEKGKRGERLREMAQGPINSSWRQAS
jgi:hypothetical protein